METKIAKYGNSLTVRLPAALARELDLREGDRVTMRRTETGLAVERPVRSRLALRLETVRECEAEIGTGRARGRELEE